MLNNLKHIRESYLLGQIILKPHCLRNGQEKKIFYIYIFFFINNIIKSIYIMYK